MRKSILPILISLAFFAILMTATIKYVGYKKVQWENTVRSNLSEVLVGKKSQIEKALYSRIYYTKSVAAYISLRPDITNKEFYNLAEELINNDSVISSIALSKDCIIGALYPLEGHEEAIGLNLLAHPDRRRIVEKTINTHLPYVAGPVELVEGGIAFISYMPIFDKTSSIENDFWGVTDIVINRDQLFNEVKLLESEDGFNYSLRGFDGQGDSGAVFWGNENVFQSHPETVSIELPYGNWILAAAPEDGWKGFIDQDKFLLYILIIASTIISALIWVLSKVLVTNRLNELELQAIFNSLDSLIIDFDYKGTYKKIATVNNKLLFKPKEYLLGKTIFEVFDQKTAETFSNAIQECLNKKKLVTIEYPLEIEREQRWFAARLSFKSEKRVIFNAYDISEQKKANDEILESEKTLRNLNATKDKLLSILSHDLKSPFNSLLGLSEILYEEIDEMPKVRIKELVNSIKDTTNETFNLLTNLLNWALSQQGRITVKPQKLEVEPLVAKCLQQYEGLAKEKLITIFKNFAVELHTKADSDTIELILRNLISNAIKFTPKGGTIHVSTSMTDKYAIIKIKDEGVGIAPDILQDIFTLNLTESKRGTENEKGTGLGLLLCKEFADLNDASIEIQSEVGIGTEIILKLPLQVSTI